MSKISVITVNYNDKSGLEKTIASVIGQTFADIEYIVIDGDSTDGSKEVIEAFKKKIDIAVSEPDSGIYNAMNKGIRAASGEYLFFLNAGDVFIDETILSQVMAFIDGSKDYYYGNVIFKEGANEMPVVYPDELSFHFFTYNCICHQTSFLKRELFERYFYYNETLKIVSDWEFLVYTIFLKNITYQHIPITVSYYDFTGISSRPESEALKKTEREIVMQKYFRWFIEDYQIMEELRSKRIQYVLHIKKFPWAWKILKTVSNTMMLFLPKMKPLR
ncbi:MAG TPA: glycosyltransferase family 2 protein [Flavobacterium sp.]|nr:glycosyltransferase family 2 protein [Flavobacterium sp.]